MGWSSEVMASPSSVLAIWDSCCPEILIEASEMRVWELREVSAEGTL